ncbi:MAG: molybdopterin cofactor-binding domain-containing protein [Ramlibacter sp.]
MNTTATTSRRDFVKVSALGAGGLLLGVAIPGLVKNAQAAGTLYTPNAWVHIADDNTITLISARSEMGQGVWTSMPMLIAEELNVDITKIKVAMAPPNAKLYGNPLLGGPQLTGGSTSVRDGWEKLRVAGAQVREMLVSAAAVEHQPQRPGRGQRHGDRPARHEGHVWRAGRSGLEAAGAGKAADEGPQGLPHRRQAHAEAGHACQGQWHGGVRHRRQAARHGLRGAGAVPGDRRHRQELRRRQGQVDAGRDRGGADSRWGCGGGGQLVARQHGAQAGDGGLG